MGSELRQAGKVSLLSKSPCSLLNQKDRLAAVSPKSDQVF